jgi:hypothetical protein
MESPLASPSSFVPAELVIRNGRKQGTRRPLKAPITIIGSADGCDVRLNVKSVRPVHCIIALGPHGPHLRSAVGKETFVNGTLEALRLLSNGDVIGIGPFEFEVRWMAPLAEAVEDNVQPLPQRAETKTGPAPAAPVDEKRLHGFHRQLADARARFRREREEQATKRERETQQLAAARADLERREIEVARERLRLLDLRKRFIKRWKNHWSTERRRLDSEAERVRRESEQLHDASGKFETERERFRAQVEIENHQVEQGWEQLREAEKRGRMERARQQADLDQRQQALADAEAQALAERDACGLERMRAEHHSADLRIEADGLESRIVNLRAVLLQLEASRAAAALDSGKAPEPAAPLSFDESEPADPAIDQRRAELGRMAEELADQRLALLEQVDRLAMARELWREAEARIVAEMSELAEQLRRREDRIVDHEKAAAFEEDELEKQRATLNQAREHLDGWQSRLEAREAAWKSESTRLQVELNQRDQQAQRRERALTELCRRWSERRRLEVVQLRAEHRRCEKLRMAWTEERSGHDERERKLFEQQRDLAARALVLEQARQRLLETAKKPLLARKRLEWLDRHMRSATSKFEARIQERWQAIVVERGQLEDVFRKATERVAHATTLGREFADRSAEIERREMMIGQRELVLGENQTVWNVQRQIFEREREELRDEIDRLAGLLVDSDGRDVIPLARAA